MKRIIVKYFNRFALTFVMFGVFSSPGFSYVITNSSGGFGKWGSAELGQSGGTVTYSFMPAGSLGCEPGLPCSSRSLDEIFGVTTAIWKSEIARAFSAWSAVANIDFLEVPDLNESSSAIPRSGQIRIGAHSDFSSSVLAHANVPLTAPANDSVNLVGDIHFNADRSWHVAGSGSGADLFLVALHEIGHSLGLYHDNTELAVMNSALRSGLTGLQPDDIAGIQALYGARVTVPEPGSWVLMFAGLGILLVVNRKRLSTKDNLLCA